MSSTTRLRLVGVTLTPHFMVDDGEDLTPLQVNPIDVSVKDWPNVVGLFADATAQLREQVEGPADDA